MNKEKQADYEERQRQAGGPPTVRPGEGSPNVAEPAKYERMDWHPKNRHKHVEKIRERIAARFNTR